MLVFGFGISTDVNISPSRCSITTRATKAAPISKSCGARRYFVEKPPLTDYADLEKRLASGVNRRAIEIPPGFGRDIARGRPVWVGRLDRWREAVSSPRRSAAICRAMHQLYLTDPARNDDATGAAPAREYRGQVQIQSGFRQHLCHGAGDNWRCCWRCSRRS